jgi:hypothetical protein
MMFPVSMKHQYRRSCICRSGCDLYLHILNLWQPADNFPLGRRCPDERVCGLREEEACKVLAVCGAYQWGDVGNAIVRWIVDVWKSRNMVNIQLSVPSMMNSACLLGSVEGIQQGRPTAAGHVLRPTSIQLAVRRNVPWLTLGKNTNVPSQ